MCCNSYGAKIVTQKTTEGLRVEGYKMIELEGFGINQVLCCWDCSNTNKFDKVSIVQPVRIKS